MSPVIYRIIQYIHKKHMTLPNSQDGRNGCRTLCWACTCPESPARKRSPTRSRIAILAATHHSESRCKIISALTASGAKKIDAENGPRQGARQQRPCSSRSKRSTDHRLVFLTSQTGKKKGSETDVYDCLWLVNSPFNERGKGGDGHAR